MHIEFRRMIAGMLSVILISTAFCIPISSEVHEYRSVQTDSMRIALTFDDGPHPTLTPKILAILEKYNIQATFFMVGRNVIDYSDTARAVLAAGHEVGNHTFSHRHIKQMDEESLNDELGLCEDALEELCEYRPHLFRPPEGAVTQYVEHCTELGDYSLILWSLDTRDWEIKKKTDIVKTVLDNVRPGDIILMHDFIGRKSATPEALEAMLPELIRRGYEFVTVSQLLGLG
jgi:peptidoglycan/xylan/chitin deacetylase (PgdA/CDA1 family)